MCVKFALFYVCVVKSTIHLLAMNKKFTISRYVALLTVCNSGGFTIQPICFFTLFYFCKYLIILRLFKNAFSVISVYLI